MRKGGIPAAVHTPHGGFGVFSRATAGWCSGGGGGGGAGRGKAARVREEGDGLGFWDAY